MKKVIIFIMLLVGLLVITGCSNQYEDDYFTYWKGKSGDEKVYYIRGLNEKGREQEYLILPTEVNGFKTKLKEGSFGPIYGDITLKSQTLFVPSYFTYISELCFSFSDEDSKLIVFSNNLEKVDLSNVLNDKKIYVSSFLYNSKKYHNTSISVANVSYNYNYEGSPNAGYYWLDDYDGEIIKFIPSAPTREGYKFGGWYKEQECINVWDFENDLIANKEYDEEGNYIYKETVLFAKWISLSE